MKRDSGLRFRVLVLYIRKELQSIHTTLNGIKLNSKVIDSKLISLRGQRKEARMIKPLRKTFVAVLAVLITISGLYTPEYVFASEEVQNESLAGSQKVGHDDIKTMIFKAGLTEEYVNADSAEELSANCSLLDYDDMGSSEDDDEIQRITIDAKGPKLSKSMIVNKPGKSKTMTVENLPAGEWVEWPSSDDYTTYEPFGEGNCSCKITALQPYYGLAYCSFSNNRCYWTEAGVMNFDEDETVEVEDGKTKTVRGRVDFKKMAQFVLIVNERRLSQGRSILDIGFPTGSYTRACEMPFTKEPFIRPNGLENRTAYDNDSGTVAYRSEWFGSGMNMKKCYKQMRMTQSCADAMDSSTNTTISVAVFKTVKKYKVSGSSYNEFMAVAYGY